MPGASVPVAGGGGGGASAEGVCVDVVASCARHGVAEMDLDTILLCREHRKHRANGLALRSRDIVVW